MSIFTDMFTGSEFCNKYQHHVKSHFKKVKALLMVTALIVGCQDPNTEVEIQPKQTTLVIELSNVSDLKMGDKVLCNGLEIGEVSKMQISKSGESIYVTTVIQKEIDIPRGSKFYFTSVDLLGTKGIEIFFSDSTAYFQNMDTIYGHQEETANIDLEELMSEFLELLRPADRIMLDTMNKDRLFNEIMEKVTDSLLQLDVIHIDDLPHKTGASKNDTAIRKAKFKANVNC